MNRESLEEKNANFETKNIVIRGYESLKTLFDAYRQVISLIVHTAA
jgi:hypothetical protein